MNGLYAIPIFSVVLMGLINRRVPASAANIALAGGFIIISLGYFVPGLSKIVSIMHDFHFLGAVFLFLLLFMFIAGKIIPLESPWEQKDSGHVDLTPWIYAKPFGYSLVTVVLLTFIFFAETSVIGFP